MWDLNSVNVCPCACRKRWLIVGYKQSNTTGLLHSWSSCMQCGGQLGSWSLGCPGLGNKLFLRQMSYFSWRTNGILEGRSCITVTVVRPIFLWVTPLCLVTPLFFNSILIKCIHNNGHNKHMSSNWSWSDPNLTVYWFWFYSFN